MPSSACGIHPCSPRRFAAAVGPTLSAMPARRWPCSTRCTSGCHRAAALPSATIPITASGPSRRSTCWAWLAARMPSVCGPGATTRTCDQIDPLITYLWYPLDLRPINPVAADTAPARYFEVTQNRGRLLLQPHPLGGPGRGFLCVRNPLRAEQPRALRHELVPARGVRDALCHARNALPLRCHANHGVDFEHNMIIIDEGGWPKHDSDSPAETTTLPKARSWA